MTPSNSDILDFISIILNVPVSHLFTCKTWGFFWPQHCNAVNYCLSHMRPLCRCEHKILKPGRKNLAQCFCKLFVPEWFSRAKYNFNHLKNMGFVISYAGVHLYLVYVHEQMPCTTAQVGQTLTLHWGPDEKIQVKFSITRPSPLLWKDW